MSLSLTIRVKPVTAYIGDLVDVNGNIVAETVHPYASKFEVEKKLGKCAEEFAASWRGRWYYGAIVQSKP